MSLSTGGYNLSDWMNRNIGNVIVTFDNLVGVFEIGEVVKEYSNAIHTIPTGKYGRILAKTATTLILIFVDNTATFSNNFYLLGQNSGATADVNGNSKDVNTGVYHYTGYTSKDFTVAVRWWTATTFVEATAIALHQATTTTVTYNYGVAIIDKSTDYFLIQTAPGGVEIQSDGGVGVLTNQDYSIQIFIKRVI